MADALLNSWQWDWGTLIPLAGFAATALSVWKDAAKQGQKGGIAQQLSDKPIPTRRIWRFDGWHLALLGVAVAAVVIQVVHGQRQTAAKRAQEARSNQEKEALLAQIGRLEGQGKDHFDATIEKAQSLVTRLNNSTDMLTRQVNVSTTAMTGAVNRSSEQIQRGLTVAESQLKDEISGLNDVLSLLKRAQEQLGTQMGGLDKAVHDSGAALSANVNAAARESAESFGRHINVSANRSIESIGTYLMQLPVQVPQGGSQHLLGPLGDIRVSVGNVSRHKDTTVTVTDLNTGKELKVTFNFNRKEQSANECSKPNDDKQCIRLEHMGREYNIRVWPFTPSNLFGGAPDSLWCQATSVNQVAAVK